VGITLEKRTTSNTTIYIINFHGKYIDSPIYVMCTLHTIPSQMVVRCEYVISRISLARVKKWRF